MTEPGLSQLQEHLRALTRLAESPDWKLFCDYLAASTEGLRTEVLSPLADPNDRYLREFQKGHLHGLMRCPPLLESFTQHVAAAINEIHVDLEKEQGDVGQFEEGMDGGLSDGTLDGDGGGDGGDSSGDDHFAP